MSRQDRRSMLRMAIGAALAPVLASRALATPGQSTLPIAIAPPGGTMVFRRELDRQLGGSAHLVVTREFAVRFLPRPGGYEVSGRQLSAHVDAPANLADLARLEEQRVERGIFPLRLDSGGLILDGEANQPGEEIESAFRIAAQRLGLANGTQDGADELAQLVEAMHRAGSGITSELPADLFAPLEQERRQERQIALPWGGEGMVHMLFNADRDSRTGLMRRASREIVTELMGDRRRTLESWQLLPAAERISTT